MAVLYTNPGQAKTLTQRRTTSTRMLDTDELYQLAQLKGGSVAAAAEDLVHPEKSILSTMSEKFKSGFSEFVDLISKPNQIVAGVLSSDLTISEAMKENISTSDVLWGDSDPNANTLSKIGSFSVRFATDVLLDPLTYVTFGAGAGFAGLRALPKVTLGKEAAEAFGRKSFKMVDGQLVKDTAELPSVALNKEGFKVFSYLKKIEKQVAGTDLPPAWTGKVDDVDNVFNMAKDELETAMKATVDATVDVDFTKRAMRNLLEKYPQLTETLLDKGGVKFFGQQILSGQKIAAVMEAIPGWKLADQLTFNTRMAIAAPFSRSLVKVDGAWKRLPEEFLEAETRMRDLAKNYGDERLNELNNIVEANGLTVAEGKFLMAAAEARKMPSDGRLANAYKQLLKFNDDELKFIQRMGKNITSLEKHAPHVLNQLSVKNVGNILPPKTTVGATTKRKIKGSIFSQDAGELSKLESAVLTKDQKLIDDTFAKLKNEGMEIFDDNLISAHIQRTNQNIKELTSRQFIRDLAADFGEFGTKAPRGWRPIDVKNINKEIDDVWGATGRFAGKEEQILFHPAIAEKVEKFAGAVINDASTQDILKAYDSLLNFWKGSVTAIFPAFHGRNAISNVFLNLMDLGMHALNPVIHTQATQALVMNKQYEKLLAQSFKMGDEGTKALDDLHKLMTKEVFTDSHGYKWTFGELRQELSYRNIAFGRNILGSLDFDQAKKALVGVDARGGKKAFAKKALPISNEFKPFTWGRGVGSAVEQQARMVNFFANLKATGDVSLAAQRTKQFLFDYQALTPFEKNVMRRFIPFYTFTRKNLELQVKSLLTTPGRVAAEVKAVQTLGDVLSGGDLTQAEREALPDWIKSGLGVLAERRGSTVSILQGFGTPLEQPFQAFQPNILLGSISPLLRVPVEQATGYSFFQGKALSDVTNAAAFKSAPKVVQDLVGYTSIEGKRSDGTPFTWHVSMRPEMMNFLLNLPLARILSATKQMQAVDVDTQFKVMQQLVGVRPYAFDIEQEAAKRERELRKQLEDLLNKAGVVAKFERVFIPKGN